MGQHKLPRINFRLTEEQKQRLEQWAKSENRTVSNLVETLVGEALKQKYGAEQYKEDK